MGPVEFQKETENWWVADGNDVQHFDAKGNLVKTNASHNAFVVAGYYDDPFALLAGDFDGDRLISSNDIDHLCRAIIDGASTSDGDYDLDHDGHVDRNDVRHLVEDIAGTTYGDANLDGRFDSEDIVLVFQAGQYMDDLMANSSWSTGDWNCDGEFDTEDIVLAFQAGGYTV